MSDTPVPAPPRSATRTLVPSPPTTGARIAASIVDGIACIVLGALAWRYERYVLHCMVLIALIAGVRVSDLLALRNGGNSGGGAGGVAGALLAFFAGPWFHR